jgi:hypothetical protein
MSKDKNREYFIRMAWLGRLRDANRIRRQDAYRRVGLAPLSTWLSADAMSKVTLRLRDLQTGQPGTGEHESIEAATAWLRDRPAFTEVLGVVFEGLTREQSDAMRAAMRPLNDAERAKAAALDAEAAAQIARDTEKRRRETDEMTAKARADAKNADPNRPMELIYRFDVDGLQKSDPLDDRPITDEARDSVMAWVLEREEWVRPRGQTIGEAKLVVYPNRVPDKQSRIVSGSFVPVTASIPG